MDTKKIQMRYYNGTDYDILVPETDYSVITGDLEVDIGQIQGILPIEKGGTGQQTASSGLGALINGTSAVNELQDGYYISVANGDEAYKISVSDLIQYMNEEVRPKKKIILPNGTMDLSIFDECVLNPISRNLGADNNEYFTFVLDNRNLIIGTNFNTGKVTLYNSDGTTRWSVTVVGGNVSSVNWSYLLNNTQIMTKVNNGNYYVLLDVNNGSIVRDVTSGGSTNSSGNYVQNGSVLVQLGTSNTSNSYIRFVNKDHLLRYSVNQTGYAESESDDTLINLIESMYMYEFPLTGSYVVEKSIVTYIYQAILFRAVFLIQIMMVMFKLLIQLTLLL